MLRYGACATPSHFRCLFDLPVTTSGLTGAQETWLMNGYRSPGAAILDAATLLGHPRWKCGGNGTPRRQDRSLIRDGVAIAKEIAAETRSGGGRTAAAMRTVPSRQSSSGDQAGSDAKLGLDMACSFRPVRSTE